MSKTYMITLKTKLPTRINVGCLDMLQPVMTHLIKQGYNFKVAHIDLTELPKRGNAELQRVFNILSRAY